MAIPGASVAADASTRRSSRPPAPHGATAWVDERDEDGPRDERVVVDDGPQELTVTLRHDPRPDGALDAALAAWAWLELALLVLAARLGFGAAGAPSVAASAGPWLVGPLFAALVVVSALGALLVRARFRRAEHEVLRTDGEVLWIERHAPLEVRTRAFEVERIHELRVTPAPRGDRSRWPRRWWPAARLAFEVEGRTTLLGHDLDDEAAERVLEALAPWLERGGDGARRVVPHGATLVNAVPPELGEGATRCGRCGAEQATPADAAIAWCDGCAAWVEVLREPSPADAHAASRLLTADTLDDLPVLVLARRPTLAVRLRRAAAVVVLGAGLFAAVSAFALAAPTIPEPRVRLAVLGLGLVSATLTALAALAWTLLRQPPHRIVLFPDGPRIEWRRGPRTHAVQLAYERTTALDVHVGKHAAVVARMGAVTVPVASGLEPAQARRLAAAVRHHLAHAAWRAGRTPGWVARMELACRRCGNAIEPERTAGGAAPDPVRCEHCERVWPLAEALAPSLARVALEPERSDQLEVSTSPIHGTVVRVATAPPWRRLAAFVPALALAGGGWAAFRWLPHLGVTSLRSWSMIAVGTGVLLAFRALAIATVRAHELRVGHDTLTLRRVRLAGSTERRIPIERVAAVVRPVRGRRAAEDEPRRAAVRLAVRRLLPIPGLGPERIRLGAHLPAHEQLWLAHTLDRLIFETAYPPAEPAVAREHASGAALRPASEVPAAEDDEPVAIPAGRDDDEPHGSATNERMHST